MPDTKKTYISLARILGMFIIVLCHIVPLYDFIPANIALGQFFGCGVQLFIFISGYLYGNKIVNDFKKWYFTRFLTVSLPAIIVSLFVILALLMLNQSVSISSIIAYLFDVEGILWINWNFSRMYNEIEGLGHLWFTTIIMLCYLLVPLLQAFTKHISTINSTFILLFSIIGTILSILISKYIMAYDFLLFAIGYFCGKRAVLDRITTKGFVGHTVAFFVCAIMRIILRKFLDDTFIYSTYVAITRGVLGTWFVTLFAYFYKTFPTQIQKISDSSVMNILDKYSYHIYLAHGIFTGGVFNMYTLFEWPVATITFVLCTIIVAILSQYTSSRILKFCQSK